MTEYKIKVKEKDNWSVKSGYLEFGKWYKAEVSKNDEEWFEISGEYSLNGHTVWIGNTKVEVRNAIKLEVGKKYVTKGGRVVGPMVYSHHNWTDEYGHKSEYMDENNWCYSENGHFIYADLDDDENIVSEYVEEGISGYKPTIVIFDEIVNESDEFQNIELKVDAKERWRSFEEYSRIFSETLEEHKNNPVEEVTIKRLKAGTYGRLKLSTDGYHAINISVVDGGRTWSKDDLEKAIETLTKIKDAR